MAKEVWNPCKSYTGYEASSTGRVRSNKKNWRSEKILKPYVDRYGYKRLHLSVNGKSKMVRVHQLVADAFLSQKDGFEVNHIDGDKTNNEVSNLELVSRKENMMHAQEQGLRDAVVGENNHLSKLTETDAIDIRNARVFGFTQQELADAWNVGRTTIRAVINHTTWKHI